MKSYRTELESVFMFHVSKSEIMKEIFPKLVVANIPDIISQHTVYSKKIMTSGYLIRTFKSNVLMLFSNKVQPAIGLNSWPSIFMKSTDKMFIAFWLRIYLFICFGVTINYVTEDRINIALCMQVKALNVDRIKNSQEKSDYQGNITVGTEHKQRAIRRITNAV